MKKKIFSRMVLLILAMACIVHVQAQKKPAPKPAKRTVTRDSYMYIENDSLNVNGDNMITYRDGSQLYRIRMRDDKVTEMYIDDQKIPEADFSKYDAVIKKIRLQIKKDREQAEIDRQQALKDQEQAQKDREQAELDAKEAEGERARSQEDAKQAEFDSKQAAKDMEQARHDQQQAMKDMEQAKLDRKQAEEDRRIYKGLVSDLISAKVIKDEGSLHGLNLTSSELIVNGVKQPAGLHQKLKAKYLKDSRTQVKFSNSGNHRGLSVEKDEEQ
jgi:hypothetical protein